MHADRRHNDVLTTGRFDLNFHLTRTSNVPSMIARRVSPTLLVLAALAASCSKPEIKTYRVAKDNSLSPTNAAAAPAACTPASAPAATPNTSGAAAPGASGMAQTAVPTAGGAGLTWTAPSHWKAKPSSAMRKGSFAVAGEGGEADLSITAFPGNVGGELANLNRWREQVKLPPVSQEEFDRTAQRSEKNGLRRTVVDLVGTGPGAQRILGAMIPHGSATWFVKLTGPDALVAKEKPAFLAFLDTIKAAPAAQ
jgi:hypothetical protein